MADALLANQSQTFTISSCRFYLDEGYLYPSLMETFERYNRIVEWAYNYKYDERFLDVKHARNFTQDAKRRYLELYNAPLKDYYVTSLESKANGIVRSQRELLKLYAQENEARIAGCEEKISATEQSLAIHREMKAFLVERSRALKQGKAVPENGIPERYGFFLKDNKICFYKRKKLLWLDIYRYECSLDRKIRKEKNRISLIRERVKRLKTKQFLIPRRVTFGGRAEYKKKDTLKLEGQQLTQWHKRRDAARNSRINFNGRHTSKYGNFQCRYDTVHNKAEITLLDGSVFTLENLQFPYRGDELKEYLDNREGSVGYVLELRMDGHGRQYLVLKATVTREKERLNFDMSDGCIAFDTNVDHFAWCELNSTGNRVRGGIVHFSLQEKNSSESTAELAKAINQVVCIAKNARKPMVMEDLDFFQKKAAMAYQEKEQNRMLSAFAYKKISELAKGSCYRNDIGLYKVPPAYTSLIGKTKYIRPLGCDIHEAAAYVIGRRAMGFRERIPGYLKTVMKKNRNRDTFWKAWRPVQAHNPVVPWRFFQRRIPLIQSWKDFSPIITGM